MFERLFDSTVRNGPRILFAIALLVFVLALFTSFWNTTHQIMMGQNMIMEMVTGVWSAVSMAITPLIAAIVLERYPPRK